MKNSFLKIYFMLIIMKFASNYTVFKKVKSFKAQNGLLCIKALNKEIFSSSFSYPNNNITLWNITSGTIIRNLTGHDKFIWTLEVLNDGTLVSGSDDKTIKLWNTTTGQVIKTLKGHTNSVKCMTSITNEILASGSKDKTIRLWHLKSGNEIQKLTEQNMGEVYCLALLNDDRLASGSHDGIIRLWDIKTGDVTLKLEDNFAAIKSMLLLNEHTLASAIDDAEGTIKFWNTTNWKETKILKGGFGTKSLLLLNDNFLNSCKDVVKLWDNDGGYSSVNISSKFKTDTIECLAKLDDSLFFSGSKNQTIILWSISSSYKSTVTTAAYSSNSLIISNNFFVNIFLFFVILSF